MDIKLPSEIIVNSPQGGGKSHLIRYIMYQLRKQLAYGVVFTNTYFEPESYDYINRKYIHPRYNPEVLKGLMKIQADLIEQKKRGKQAFVIFDDCIDAKQFSDPNFAEICTQMRHYDITVIFAVQYCNIIPPYMRSNASYVIMFRTTSESNLKALHYSYGQEYGTYPEFKDFLMKNLGNYKFVFYDNRPDRLNKDDTDDIYKIMIAPEKLPKFKLKANKLLSQQKI